MIDLVCIDVDGTLVGSAGMIHPENWRAVERAHAAGIRLALCSGRPSFGVTSGYACRIDAGGWHIFQNGASIVRLPDGHSRSVAIPPDAVAMLVARARVTGRALELYSDDDYVVEHTGDLVRTHAELIGVPFRPRAFEQLGAPVVRAQWLVPHAESAIVTAEPRAGLERFVSTTPIMPETSFINLTLAGVTKGSAVRTVASAYGVPLERVMFVGDGHNDIPAMAIVGHPVAMANADVEVLTIARRVVGSVDDAGLAEALAFAIASRGGAAAEPHEPVLNR